MIARDRSDARLEELLLELAPPQQPDYLAAVQATARSSRQRPAWQFPGRFLPVSVEITPDMRRRVALAGLALALLAALAFAAIVGSPKRLPPPFGPAGNGQVVFDDNSQIIVSNEDGSGRHNLFDAEGTERRPSFSLDGRHVAFLRSRAGRDAVVVADADGSQQREVLVVERSGVSIKPEPPAWSPDGSRIAITIFDMSAGDALAHTEIWVIDPTSGGSTVLRPEGIHSWEAPSWSPDGHRIAFIGEPVAAAVGYLYVADPDGGNLVTLSPRPSGSETGYLGLTRWSPDGTRIALHYGAADTLDRDILVLSPDGQHEQVIGDPLDEAQPAWSPDGTHLAFWQSEKGRRQWHVVILDLDSSAQTTLPFLSGTADTMRWLPDGTAVSVSRVEPDGCKLYRLDIVNVAAEAVVLASIPCGSYDTSEDQAYWTWQRLALP